MTHPTPPPGAARAPAPPLALAAELRRRHAEVEVAWAEPPRAYLAAAAPEGGLFARWSSRAEDAAVFARERMVRELVGTGLPLRTPPVLAAGENWMLERGVAAQPLRGRAGVLATVEAAAAIARLQEPPAGGTLPVAQRTLRAALSRRARAVRGGMRPADLVLAQRLRRVAVAALPQVTSHGDFHRGNLLMEHDRPWVIDWELLGRRPAGHDLMTLWPTLEREADRALLFDATVELLGERHRAALLALRFVLAVEVAMAKLAPAQAFNADPAGGADLLGLLGDLRRELDDRPGRDNTGC